MGLIIPGHYLQGHKLLANRIQTAFVLSGAILPAMYSVLLLQLANKKQQTHSAIVVETKNNGTKVLSWEGKGWEIIDYKSYKKANSDRDLYETEVLNDKGTVLDDEAILKDVANDKSKDYDLTTKNCAQQAHRKLVKHGMNPLIQEHRLPKDLMEDARGHWGGKYTQIGKEPAKK